LKPSEAVCSDYFGYLLKSPRYIRALQITGNFIRDGQDLTFENFSEVDLFVPPYREQQIIADYISQQLSKVDQAIELKEQQIEGLREYRETLINSAVTGKIRVI
jgi:type I restriction enzyme S subunit